MALGGGPKKIGDVLSNVLARYGYADLTARSELEQAWKAIAGERFAGRTQVGTFKRGVLEILVENSILLQELESYHKHAMLARLQEIVRFNQVRMLKFRRQ